MSVTTETLRIINEVVYKGKGEAKQLTRDMGDQEKAVKKTGTSLGGLKTAWGAAAAGFAVATGAAVALGKGISVVTTLAAEQERVEAQLAATLESTGHAAGMSAEELKKLAGDLQTMTTYGDEAIIASESLLLTFTQIGKETFPRAQTAILDMATAMGQDLKAATIQVGKALNDPIKGVSALAEAGIQFSEDQKAVIKSLVETGDTAAAQALILKELETQFGGSAAAAADTFGGRMQQLQNVIGDVGEEIGKQLLPAMKIIAEESAPAILEAVKELNPEIEDFGDTLVAAAENMVPLIENLATFVKIAKETPRWVRGIITGGLSELLPLAWDAAMTTKTAAEQQEEWNNQLLETGVLLNSEVDLQALYEQLGITNEVVTKLTKSQEELNRELEIFYRRVLNGISMRARIVTGDVDVLADAIANWAGDVEVANEAVEETTEVLYTYSDAIAAAAAKTAEMQGHMGDLFVDAVDWPAQSDELAMSLFNAADAAGASAGELGGLGVALGLFDEDAAESAFKAALLKAGLDEIARAFAAGTLDVNEAKQAFINLQAEVDGTTASINTATGVMYEDINPAIQETAGYFREATGDVAGLNAELNAIPGEIVVDILIKQSGQFTPPDMTQPGVGGGSAAGNVFPHGGYSMVGEFGPEFVRLPAGAQVISTNRTAQTISNSTTINGTTRRGEQILLQHLRRQSRPATILG